MRKNLVVNFVTNSEAFAAGSTKILVPNGGVIALFALFTPDPDVA
jgi:hypothetical protein